MKLVGKLECGQCGNLIESVAEECPKCGGGEGRCGRIGEW